MTSPSGFIAMLQHVHPDVMRYGQNGSCFHVYRLLAEVFPDAEPWYDGNHVITKIGERFYDITGEVVPLPDHKPMRENVTSFNNAVFWSPWVGGRGQPIADEIAQQLGDAARLDSNQRAAVREALGPILLRYLGFVHH